MTYETVLEERFELGLFSIGSDSWYVRVERRKLPATESSLPDAKYGCPLCGKPENLGCLITWTRSSSRWVNAPTCYAHVSCLRPNAPLRKFIAERAESDPKLLSAVILELAQ